mgnify:FL=1
MGFPQLIAFESVNFGLSSLPFAINVMHDDLIISTSLAVRTPKWPPGS